MSSPVEVGREVQAFLDSEPIRAAFAKIEEDAFETWRSSNDPQMRDTIWHRIRALDDLKKQLKILVDRGTWALAKQRAK